MKKMLKPAVAFLFLSAVVIFLFFIVSCPNPITKEMLNFAKDEIAPVITITSPSPNGSYQSAITVIGTVTDTSTQEGAAGGVSSVSYEIIGAQTSGDIEIGEDGSFSVVIDTKDLTGEIDIQFSATDWNGNSADYLLTLSDDQAGPYIAITSPEADSFYSATVVVEGIVANSPEDTGTEEIKWLDYEVLSSPFRGDLSYEGGSFTFQFETGSLDGNIVVRISADDWNGNTNEQDLILVDGGSGIPSLQAAPDNHQVQLTWDDVLFAQSYTLYYTNDGSTPSEYFYHEKIDNVTSPHPITDLKNGHLHVFLLQAHSGTGDDNWSDYVKAIPLSESTLSPVIQEEYKKLVVSWNGIPGASDNGYTVLRSTDPGGSYIPIVISTPLTSYTDTSVVEDQIYYYKIQPTLQSAIISRANSAEVSPFPNEPVLRGKAATDDSRAVDVSGNYAYIADYTEGIKIFDVSDPDNPFLVPGGIFDTDYARDIVVRGNYAYVPDGAAGVKIIDVATPGNPHLVLPSGIANTNGLAMGIALRNDYAYIADFYGLFIFNISTPGIPVEETSSILDTTTSGDALKIAVHETQNYAYMAGEVDGLTIIDITTPNSPSIVAGGTVDTSSAYDVSQSGNHAYIADGSQGLKIINVASAGSPYLEPGGTVNTTSALGIEIRDDLAYIADASAGLKIINIADKGSPYLLQEGTLKTQYARDVTVDGRFAYVADDSYMRIIDVSYPRNPDSPVGGTIGTTSAKGITVSGDYAYIADANAGLKIFNISNPESPSLVPGGTVDTDSANDVAVSGNYAYIADGNTGLVVIDISNPSDPFIPLNGTVDTFSALGVEVSGDYAYIADSSWGLKIIDISDPENPFLVDGGELDTYSAKAVAVRGDYAYVADNQEGLKTINISNPELPFLVSTGTVDTLAAWDIALRGDYAYIADNSDGLKIIDISDPENPLLVPGGVVTSAALGISISGEYAYIADNSEGLKIIDISDPENPFLVHNGFYTTLNAQDVEVSGGYAFIANGSAGGSPAFIVVDLSVDH